LESIKAHTNISSTSNRIWFIIVAVILLIGAIGGYMKYTKSVASNEADNDFFDA